MHDTPESKGLPPIEVLTGEESPEQSHDHGSTSELQRSVIRNPFVWVLALSSAFMYVSRYAINGWGVLFLQEVKGYSLATATQVISVNALLGIVGMVSYVGAGLQDIVSGWLINSGKTVTDGVTTYDFDTAIVFWIEASALSFILALFVSKKSHV